MLKDLLNNEDLAKELVEGVQFYRNEFLTHSYPAELLQMFQKIPENKIMKAKLILKKVANAEKLQKIKVVEAKKREGAFLPLFYL